MSIATEISRIQTATGDIKTAIAGKGVAVPAGSKIDTLPALITSIPSGGGGGGELDALIQRTITEIHSGVTSIGKYAFYGCAALTTAEFPLATSIRDRAFQACAALTTAEFPLLALIPVFAFAGCYKLSTLILRKNDVCTLANINAFTSTSIAGGTGYVYVPASLVDAYKAATNWITYANQIRAIEDYPEITGGEL